MKNISNERLYVIDFFFVIAKNNQSNLFLLATQRAGLCFLNFFVRFHRLAAARLADPCAEAGKVENLPPTFDEANTVETDTDGVWTWAA